VDNVHAGHYLKKKYNKKKGDNKKKQNKEKHKIKEVPSGNEIFGWIRSLPACVYILSRHKKKTKKKTKQMCWQTMAVNKRDGIEQIFERSSPSVV
jgi:hypothetical protein